jgi:hypothetical protein
MFKLPQQKGRGKMTEDRKQKVLDKIRKLMAKADPERGATKEEAASFAAKAAALLEEHKLSMTDVEFLEMQTTDPVREWYVDHTELGLKTKRTRQAWSQTLAAAVARAHGCEILVHRGVNNFTLVGRQQDAEVATYMYHYLFTVASTTARRAYGAHYRQCEREGRVWAARGFHESFLTAFVYEVARRYRERKEERGTGTALIRLDQEAAAVKDFLDSTYGANRKSARALTHKVRNAAGVEAGRMAGRNVNLTNTGVKSGVAKKEIR